MMTPLAATMMQDAALKLLTVVVLSHCFAESIWVHVDAIFVIVAIITSQQTTDYMKYLFVVVVVVVIYNYENSYKKMNICM